MIPVPTREAILQRLAKGPTQFNEFAVSRNHRSKSRLAARKIVDQLKAEGLAMQIYIGAFQYWILSTEESKLQAVRQQIEESSRHDPASGCTIWTGYSDKDRGPVMRQALVGSGTGVNVRRWLFSDWTGRELDGTKESIKMSASCEEGCIDPAHMKRVTRSQILKGIKKPMAVRLALQARMKARWGKNPDAVAAIRASDKSSPELAKEFDMSPSNVWSIRSGRTYKLEANPFSGLGAR